MNKRFSIFAKTVATLAIFSTFFLVSAPVSAVGSEAFKSFSADYTISKIPNTNTSHLEISETIIDEYATTGATSHGIDRVIPARMKIGNGRSWSYHLNFLSAFGGPYVVHSLDSDALFVRVGDKNNYLHGVQTFHINYTAQDAIMPSQLITDKALDENGNEVDGDEFLWMVNGDGFEQDFLSVSAKVTVATNLVSSLDGRVACWNNGNENECKITSTSLLDGSKQFTFISLTTTKSQKSLVFDIGFKPATFAMPERIFASEDEAHGIKPLSLLSAITTIALFLLPVLIYLIYKTSIISHNSRKVKSTPIIPQFVAPDPTLALLSECEVFWSDRNLTAPLLLDLAVNGFIAITADEKGAPSGIIYQKSPDDTITDPNERALLETLFADKSIGDQISLKSLKSTRSFGKKVYDLQTSLRNSKFGSSGFFLGRKTFKSSLSNISIRVIIIILIGVFFSSGLASNSTALFSGNGIGHIGQLIVIMIAIDAVLFIILAIIFKAIGSLGTNSLMKSKKLTDRGANLFRYLSGLKEFMTVSEADRIKMLQSVKGAEKVNYRIHLYERLLPFATIFGIEKSWGDVLETYYTEIDSAPSFYSGYVHGYAWASVLNSFSSDARAISSMEASRIARETMSRSSSWSSGGSSSSGFGGGGGSFGGGGGGGGRW